MFVCFLPWCPPGAQPKVPFTQVVMEVMHQLEGAYALLFKSPHYPNEIVACKRGSPLLMGVKVGLQSTHCSKLCGSCQTGQARSHRLP